MKSEKNEAPRKRKTFADFNPRISKHDKYLYEWNLWALVNIYGIRILDKCK
ncbi:MAG: hypothetical protein G3M78_00785 [Candidatus Nitrohelix vancouverensis]|uniref:Uncharacterized protein n=1 Tax=Candidatus Nitrohelix vancouverensis TaxID=2705534 RepID=A0A7T0BZZ5_9BACT|nr:MAG: hypothetical protein G3M78_00785 [Candidatus Nitrohelix vancouverensis]